MKYVILLMLKNSTKIYWTNTENTQIQYLRCWVINENPECLNLCCVSLQTYMHMWMARDMALAYLGFHLEFDTWTL